METQIAKRPKVVDHGKPFGGDSHWYTWYCPKCGKQTEPRNHCDGCGQQILWKDKTNPTT